MLYVAEPLTLTETASQTTQRVHAAVYVWLFYVGPGLEWVRIPIGALIPCTIKTQHFAPMPAYKW